MRIYPAIDICGGKCVRLKQGDFDKITEYDADPAAVAARWAAAGASFIHVVDLDGARSGNTRNSGAVKRITKNVSVPIQIGGGIRCMRDIEYLLLMGVARVIIGTLAVSDPEFVREAASEFGDNLALGIDARDGLVAIKGWEQQSSVTASELCEQALLFGIKTIIYTDIARDGMLSGPNINQTSALAERFPLDFIASGGVSSMDDLRRLSETRCEGVVVGKALYEGAIDLREAIKTFE